MHHSAMARTHGTAVDPARADTAAQALETDRAHRSARTLRGLRSLALGTLGLVAAACMAAPSALSPPPGPAMPLPGAPPELATIDLADLRADGDRAFAELDADGDGMITETEFGQRHGHQAFLAGAGPAEIHRFELEMPDDEARFAAADTNGDGSLSLDEFRQRPHRMPPLPPLPPHPGAGGEHFEVEFELAMEAHAAQAITSAFGHLDGNEDGVITRDEWPSPEQHLERMDRDGDGLLTPEEMGAAHAWVVIERDGDELQ